MRRDAGANAGVADERYEPVVHVAEIMLTLVTVNEPPRLDEDDEEDDEAELLDDESVEPLPPGICPVTITWCPTCSARFTEESAIRLMSFPRAPLIDPEARALGSVALAPVDPDAGGADVELAPDDEPAPELMLLLPILAFFSTKPPPAPLEAVLLLELLLSRCRQPVAVTCPAMSLDERLVGWLVCGLGWLLCGLGWLLCGLGDGWLLCGLDDCGVWAASVPHNATLLQSVTAHCK